VLFARCGAADKGLEALEATVGIVHFGEHCGLLSRTMVQQETGKSGTLPQANAVAGGGSTIP